MKATPSRTARAVTPVRSLRDMRPLNETFVTGAASLDLARVRRLRTFASPRPRCSPMRCIGCARVRRDARFSLAEPRSMSRSTPLRDRLHQLDHVVGGAGRGVVDDLA